MKAVRSLLHLLSAATVLLLLYAGSSGDLHRLLHEHEDKARSGSPYEGSCNSNSDDPSDENRCKNSCAVVLFSSGLILDNPIEPLPVERHLVAIHTHRMLEKLVQGVQLTTQARAPPVL
ncbi:MAG: hypothetical protein DF168_00214 [Candidatus Moanabacter tarae]|uniref:Uncharacterized protein n=1 Tax=Candidatus Moanibacter tarae TaxID=2200854 RepID=A0A2Z4ABA4_9BACT|nr:MAG: hypothetical protein DF168_00214 [Candidatus Moanabacter tarae]|tara:strand:- start:7842 stop:8198 length:357 start_codon:yes stop_codon:yes gene_type:complete